MKFLITLLVSSFALHGVAAPATTTHTHTITEKASPPTCKFTNVLPTQTPAKGKMWGINNKFIHAHKLNATFLSGDGDEKALFKQCFQHYQRYHKLGQCKAAWIGTFNVNQIANFAPIAGTPAPGGMLATACVLYNHNLGRSDFTQIDGGDGNSGVMAMNVACSGGQ